MSRTVPKRPQKAKKRAALELSSDADFYDRHFAFLQGHAPLPNLPLSFQLREISQVWQLCQAAAAEAGLEHLMAPQHL